MISSDEEGEIFAQSVTNYEFVDHNEEPVSFAGLPVRWEKGDNSNPVTNQVFLRGSGDDGLKIYKQVFAWKFELLYDVPEVSVLSKENTWIKLVKPRKVFEDTMIKTILITVWCLHVVKKNPETLGKSLWDQLWKTFSSYEEKPSENDLLNHIPLIKAAIEHDTTLSKSKFLVALLENYGMEKRVNEDNCKGSDANKSDSISDDEDMGNEDDNEPVETLFDSICCICDDGGEILGCEGRCMRYFHATTDAGEGSDCPSLGLSSTEVEAMQNFLCLNCQLQQHQCFVCGNLGSSDKSSGAEVFSCVSATCGFFYHPECVARLLHPVDEAKAEDTQKKIAAGESFTCPAHKCHVCKGGEDKDIHDLHFAVCRRCPRAYHRTCLHWKIAFEEDESSQRRAWPDLLPSNRILIYCLKHEIDVDLETPIRNHIIFPGDEKKQLSDLQSSKEKVVVKKRYVDDEDSSEKKKPKYSDVREKSNPTERTKFSDAPRKRPKGNMTLSFKENKSSARAEIRASVAEDHLYSFNKRSASLKSKRQEATIAKPERTVKASSQVKRQSSSAVVVDAETKTRILALMDKKSSSITLKDIIKQHKVPCTYANSSNIVVDKTITHGKVEGFVEAIRTALQKLEEGGSVEDAKAVCGPQVVNRILKWKSKLRVYLGPFLYGMRYTSFGRHFTKVDKLKEIVDKLHSYVREGDTVVDFCCGSNDFSLLMKEKLEQTGKKCSFRNFDVIQPKNDFSFEKRDWMTVRPMELPLGSKLIMGLNPPFGVKASLANKFIDKALEFKPKLVILIVPPETERLDRKRPPYDLVWEDDQKLSGKSFYLPGSVDVNENAMDQWNVKAPLLYLWSRSDWTAGHKAIAQRQGHMSTYQRQPHSVETHLYQEERCYEENHIPKYQKELHPEENNVEEQVSDVPMDMSPVRENNGDGHKNNIGESGSSFASETQRWPMDATHVQNYGSWGRTPYMNDPGQYRPDPGMQQILQPYGGQGLDSLPQIGQLFGQDTGIGRGGFLPSNYGIPGSQPSFSSTVPVYAPWPDELNPGSGAGIGSSYIPGAGSGPGFAPGPPHPFHHHSSSGWLNN